MVKRLTCRQSVTAFSALAAAVVMAAGAGLSMAQPQLPPEITAQIAARTGGGPKDGDKEKDFPPFEEVTKDYTKVVSTADGQASLYTVWTREKDAQVLAELPRNFENQRLFIATTIAGGTPTAGIQFGSQYAYWKRYDKRLALIEPNVGVRSSGDAESRRSRDQLFTDRVILDLPIITMSPGGGPVIDLDDLLVANSSKFFGNYTRGANGKLSRITKAKAFPENIELAFEMPMASGRLSAIHYSISSLRESSGYQPREADERIGYFTTVHRDLGKPAEDRPWVRYINRWRLEKADPSLKLSPPKEPIVFYVEHTTPVRYRRWVRDGILEWNKAFERVGIINAVEVYQQDARSGAHMDKDPEDVRYNFHRWNSNGASFAIGPSRVDPRTGQILDADVVMNDGWIRAYALQYKRLIPEIAMEGFDPDTLAWLEARPEWDPRIRLAPAHEREQMMYDRARRNALGKGQAAAGHPAANADPTLLGDDPYDGLIGHVSQMNGACMHSMCKGMDLAMYRLSPELFAEIAAIGRGPGGPAPEGGDGDGDGGSIDDLLDGVPETFIGPLIKDVVMHEIGHTLGLRHNFKSSTVHPLKDINSEGMRGKAQIGSVMDYSPVNINFEDGPVQGDWCMMTIGPYDYWAIEYGYTLEKDLKPILARVAEPELTYATDEDTWGPDPRARRYDFGADPIEYAESQMRLAQYLRGKILDRLVKDGQNWSKARDAYMTVLARHTNAVSVAANWVGGSYINRDKRGDPGDRNPIENIPAETQRRALEFVIENAFRDGAFGLSPELLSKMTIDKWLDEGGFQDMFEDQTWPVHERIMGIQASALTMLMNPTTLRRVFDNEYRVPAGEDAITLPEVINRVSDSIWSELDSKVDKRYSAREPMVSSLRRNLQREHLKRLVDLSMPGGLSGGAAKPIATLSAYKLRELSSKIASAIERGDSKLDPYTIAHLTESKMFIDRALDSTYIYNASDLRAPAMPFMLFGAEEGVR